MIEILNTIILICQINIGMNDLNHTSVVSLLNRRDKCQTELTKCVKNTRMSDSYSLNKCISERK